MHAINPSAPIGRRLVERSRRQAYFGTQRALPYHHTTGGGMWVCGDAVTTGQCTYGHKWMTEREAERFNAETIRTARRIRDNQRARASR